MRDGKPTYAMLGMGLGNILFWVGVSVGYSFDLHPLTMLAIGFLGLYAGVSLVIQLERLDPDG